MEQAQEQNLSLHLIWLASITLPPTAVTIEQTAVERTEYNRQNKSPSLPFRAIHAVLVIHASLPFPSLPVLPFQSFHCSPQSQHHANDSPVRKLYPLHRSQSRYPVRAIRSRNLHPQTVVATRKWPAPLTMLFTILLLSLVPPPRPYHRS
jgi:hypothetical protein